MGMLLPAHRQDLTRTSAAFSAVSIRRKPRPALRPSEDAVNGHSTSGCFRMAEAVASANCFRAGHHPRQNADALRKDHQTLGLILPQGACQRGGREIQHIGSARRWCVQCMMTRLRARCYLCRTMRFRGERKARKSNAISSESPQTRTDLPSGSTLIRPRFPSEQSPQPLAPIAERFADRQDNCPGQSENLFSDGPRPAEENVFGLIKVEPDGESVRVCGTPRNGVPTSELSAHLESHLVRQQVTAGSSRVIMHCHAQSSGAFLCAGFSAPRDTRLVEMSTECLVSFRRASAFCRGWCPARNNWRSHGLSHAEASAGAVAVSRRLRLGRNAGRGFRP